MDVPGEVLMIQAGEHLLLSLWVDHEFEAEVGPIRRGAGRRTAHARPQRADPAGGRRGARHRARPPAPTPCRPASSESGVATRDTSGTRTATGGRSPTTPARSDRWCCHDRRRPTRRPSSATRGAGRRASPTGGWLLGALHARFATGDFATGLALANAIGAAAEEANHHPDLDLRYPRPTVRLVSHDVGRGDPARPATWPAGSASCRGRAGVAADPTKRQGARARARHAPTPRAVLPFWAAVLDFKHARGRPEVIDPDGRITDALVPADRAARRAPAAVPPRPRGADRAGAGRGSTRRWRPAGRWSPTSTRRLLGARRRRGQQGLRLHSGRAARGLIGCWDRRSRILGRVGEWLTGG